MGVREDIKVAILRSGKSMSDVVHLLNEKYKRTDTLQNFSNKLTRGTLRYNEALEVAEVLGCEIQWIPKKNSDQLPNPSFDSGLILIPQTHL
ncbi:MAG: LLM class flavin-dependent oxidoreductase [Negativicutes bacterium]|nr:LLM class flavin-dependent oxidoreductase [Negativicutes bacterium]